MLFICQGIPEQAEAPPVARVPPSGQTNVPPVQAPQPAQPAGVPSSGPNANPLDLFPQAGTWNYLVVCSNDILIAFEHQ